VHPHTITLVYAHTHTCYTSATDVGATALEQSSRPDTQPYSHIHPHIIILAYTHRSRGYTTVTEIGATAVEQINCHTHTYTRILDILAHINTHTCHRYTRNKHTRASCNKDACFLRPNTPSYEHIHPHISIVALTHTVTHCYRRWCTCCRTKHNVSYTSRCGMTQCMRLCLYVCVHVGACACEFVRVSVCARACARAVKQSPMFNSPPAVRGGIVYVQACLYLCICVYVCVCACVLVCFWCRRKRNLAYNQPNLAYNSTCATTQ